MSYSRISIGCIHPIVFACAPALGVYSANVGYVDLVTLWQTLAILTGVTIMMWSIAAAILRSVEKGALLTSGVALLCLSAEPLYSLILPVDDEGSTYSITLIVLSLVLGAVALRMLARFLRRTHEGITTLTRVACVCSLAMFAPTAVSLVNTHAYAWSAAHVSGPEIPDGRGIDPHSSPNIYYIVLDGYGRSDVLRARYGFENEWFLNRLTELGFYVARKSRSNYSQTVLSLASSLNVAHLEELLGDVPASYRTRDHALSLLTDSAVVRFLKRRGYRFSTFVPSYSAHDLVGVDHLVASAPPVSEFHATVLSHLTPIPRLIRVFSLPLPQFDLFDVHEQHIREIFDKLPTLHNRSQGPSFVLAHILSPHPPFIFREDGTRRILRQAFSLYDTCGEGTARNEATYIEGYRAQATFVSARILKSIEAILAHDPGAVIVVQGDHGPAAHQYRESVERSDLKERLSILNAIRVPDHSALYPSITPVNTFRVIFNQLFGTELQPQADESFYSLYDSPMVFTRYTEAPTEGSVAQAQLTSGPADERARGVDGSSDAVHAETAGGVSPGSYF